MAASAFKKLNKKVNTLEKKGVINDDNIVNSSAEDMFENGNEKTIQPQQPKPKFIFFKGQI